jgi:hypothetical protein
MDQLEHYRTIIEQVLTRRVNDLKDFPTLHDKTVFDRRTDSYLLLREGWDKSRRIHAIIVHLELRDGKIWVQEDWTEHGVAADLEEVGIPKSEIVLGFQPPEVRSYTEYAAA